MTPPAAPVRPHTVFVSISFCISFAEDPKIDPHVVRTFDKPFIETFCREFLSLLDEVSECPTHRSNCCVGVGTQRKWGCSAKSS